MIKSKLAIKKYKKKISVNLIYISIYIYICVEKNICVLEAAELECSSLNPRWFINYLKDLVTIKQKYIIFILVVPKNPPQK